MPELNIIAKVFSRNLSDHIELILGISDVDFVEKGGLRRCRYDLIVAVPY